jgi:hypothetical protein
VELVEVTLEILRAKYGAGDFEIPNAVFILSSNTGQTFLKLLTPYLYFREIPGRCFQNEGSSGEQSAQRYSSSPT